MPFDECIFAHEQAIFGIHVGVGGIALFNWKVGY